VNIYLNENKTKLDIMTFKNTIFGVKKGTHQWREQVAFKKLVTGYETCTNEEVVSDCFYDEHTTNPKLQAKVIDHEKSTLLFWDDWCNVGRETDEIENPSERLLKRDAVR
jgi:hypothetical protein